jgi:uncharacterized protein YkwD
MGLAPRGWRLVLVGLVPAALAVPLALRTVTTREPAAAVNADTADAAPGGTTSGAGAPTACAGPAPEAEQPDYEQEVVALVNAQRRQAGLPPLKRVEPLMESARWFAHDMARDDYFAEDHDTYDRRGRGVVRRCAWSARVGFYYPGWNSLAENIAAGYDSPAEVVSGWLRSPGHRAKMLGRNTWETGVGFASGGSEGTYWVQDFGRRARSFPLVIEDEAARTSRRDVRLYVYGSWDEMRLRNDDAGFSPWRSFTNELVWQLAPGDGTRRVTVELRGGRQRATTSDTIELEEQ